MNIFIDINLTSIEQLQFFNKHQFKNKNKKKKENVNYFLKEQSSVKFFRTSIYLVFHRMKL